MGYSQFVPAVQQLRQQMESITDIVGYINRTIDSSNMHDYCPNGLQVQGRDDVSHIVSGVTASEAFLLRAIEAGADAVLVHHGYFWRGEDPVITGMKRRRLGLLLEANVSLLAYHLPLDVHPEFGNNAQLGQRLGFVCEGRLTAGDTEGLVFYGHLPTPLSAQALADHLVGVLGRVPLAVGNTDREISRLAWCSGGAQGYIDFAAKYGFDAYISGEISEQTTHSAREHKMLYLAAGHHATERFGVQALGEHLTQQMQVTHEFIDIDNPA